MPTAQKAVSLARTSTHGVWLKIVLLPREGGGMWPYKVFVHRTTSGYDVESRVPEFNKDGLPLLDDAREFIRTQADKFGGLL